MAKAITFLVFGFFGSGLFFSERLGAQSEPFYKGKTVRLIVDSRRAAPTTHGRA
jgi:hypothetical protein